MNADNARGASLSDTYARERDVNLGYLERLGSLAAAAALGLLSARRRSYASAIGALASAFLLHRGVTGRCPVYRAMGRNTATRKERAMARMERGASASVLIDRGIKLDERVVIGRRPSEVYAFFRDLHNLPRVMSHVERVEVSNSRLSHWTVQGPAGARLEWDAEIINDQRDQLLAWRSREGSDVRNAGSVHFAPRDGGMSTELRVQMKYDPPAGAVGAAVARFFGRSADLQLREDLWRLKSELEH